MGMDSPDPRIVGQVFHDRQPPEFATRTVSFNVQAFFTHFDDKRS